MAVRVPVLVLPIMLTLILLCSDSKLNYTLVVTNRTFQDIPNHL